MINEEQLNELNLKGWIEFCSVNIDEHLIDISKKIGEVISHPNGKLIDYLTPKEKKEAKKILLVIILNINSSLCIQILPFGIYQHDLC